MDGVGTRSAKEVRNEAGFLVLRPKKCTCSVSSKQFGTCSLLKRSCLAVSDTLRSAGPRCVIEDAAMQLNVLAASEDVQRVELQVLHRAHGLLGARDASPAPPGPQTLLAEDEATGCLDGDG